MEPYLRAFWAEERRSLQSGWSGAETFSEQLLVRQFLDNNKSLVEARVCFDQEQTLVRQCFLVVHAKSFPEASPMILKPKSQIPGSARGVLEHTGVQGLGYKTSRVKT